MQTTWFAVALVFLILSMGGLVTAAVLCFCRQRVPTPRHPHNAHNAQSHPPVSFPCESQKTPLLHVHDRFACSLLVVAARSRCNLATASQFRSLWLTSRTVTSKHGENFPPPPHDSDGGGRVTQCRFSARGVIVCTNIKKNFSQVDFICALKKKDFKYKNR